MDLLLRGGRGLPVRPPHLVHDQQRHHHTHRGEHLGAHPQQPHQTGPPHRPAAPLHHHPHAIPHGGHPKTSPLN
ncbi:hypothetical protein ACFVHW_15440 [Streptomyces sp. NPDC127110]|uniref:hypothetical protein n=1 Tax=Streptomyces sp. NPDC127110 TaxID=3345362 RepID=UPI00363F4C3C